MPLQYTGIIDEHMAVRTSAGMFDVSHMGEFYYKGDIDAINMWLRWTSQSWNHGRLLTPCC